jgi:hypothetical protein
MTTQPFVLDHRAKHRATGARGPIAKALEELGADLAD